MAFIGISSWSGECSSAGQESNADAIWRNRMTTPNPRCAVIIPTYNCAEYLPAALESVAAQGVADLEVIVIDDGSSDGTDAVLKRAEQLPGLGRLRCFQTRQIGPGLARNFGVEVARAPLIAFLDADDVWLPGKLEPQLAFHEARPDVVLSFTDYRHRGPSGDDRGTCFEFWGHGAGSTFATLPRAASVLLGCNLVGTSTVVLDRAAFMEVNGFGGEMPSSEDWDLWLKLARRGPIARSGQIGCDYLMRPNSVTAARASRIVAMEMILDRALRAFPKPDARDVRRARARIATARAEHDREQGNVLRASLRHAAALALDPSRRGLRATMADLGRWALRPVLGGVARRA